MTYQWRDQAACRTANPADFDDDAHPEGIARARRTCNRCTVLLDCGLDAVATKATGVIRAGYAWRDGRAIRLKRCVVCARWSKNIHCSPACKTSALSRRTCHYCLRQLTHCRPARYCNQQCHEAARRALESFRARYGITGRPEAAA